MSETLRREWDTLTTHMPRSILKKARKRMIDDGITMRQLVVSVLGAYAAREISIELNPVMRGKNPRYGKLVDADDFRILIKTQSGEILNPLPLTDIEE